MEGGQLACSKDRTLGRGFAGSQALRAGFGDCFLLGGHLPPDLLGRLLHIHQMLQSHLHDSSRHNDTHMPANMYKSACRHLRISLFTQRRLHHTQTLHISAFPATH